MMTMVETGKTKELAALQTGMDRKTARKYLEIGRLPSEVEKEHTWRTRTDPFEEVWNEVLEKLKPFPRLEAKTLFDFLQREYPGRFADGQLRTLQRRVKCGGHLKALERKCFFPRNIILVYLASRIILGWVSLA